MSDTHSFPWVGRFQLVRVVQPIQFRFRFRAQADITYGGGSYSAAWIRVLNASGTVIADNAEHLGGYYNGYDFFSEAGLWTQWISLRNGDITDALNPATVLVQHVVRGSYSTNCWSESMPFSWSGGSQTFPNPNGAYVPGCPWTLGSIIAIEFESY